MKTHELARALTSLAKWLRAVPDAELSSLDPSSSTKRSQTAGPPDAVALSTLVAFSKFSKRQWAELIEEYDLPVQVLSTHSARDVMGKIMNFFAENPDARQNLIERVERQPSKASPELMRALTTLLGK